MYIPGSSKCLKFVPFHQKKPTKRQKFYISRRCRYIYISYLFITLWHWFTLKFFLRFIKVLLLHPLTEVYIDGLDLKEETCFLGQQAMNHVFMDWERNMSFCFFSQKMLYVPVVFIMFLNLSSTKKIQIGKLRVTAGRSRGQGSNP